MNATSRLRAIELGDRDLALGLLGRLQRRLQLRPALERVGALAGLDLGELADDLEAFRRGKGCNGLALSLEPEAGAALLLGRDAVVGDEG